VTASLVAALLWLISANVTGMFPSRKNHWPQAYALIALGLPVLGWVFWESGAVLGVLVLAAACSVLRWPVRYLLRWLRGMVRGEEALPPSP
jgi:hypothetical protein